MIVLCLSELTAPVVREGVFQRVFVDVKVSRHSVANGCLGLIFRAGSVPVVSEELQKT